MKTKLIIFLCLIFPFIAHSQTPIISFRRVDLPSTSKGPEDTTFDFRGRVYTGISDGRVVRYVGRSSLIDAYITSPNRTSLVCDGTNDPGRLGLICGRPIGLGFYIRENKLYIGDAFRGLLVAGAQDRLALPVISNDTSVGIKFAAGLDVDQINGNVYYAIASTRFNLSEIETAVVTNDSTGKLLKYNPNTNQVTQLLHNLSGPAGVALSSDRSYLLVTEFIGKRIVKYFLSGPRASTSQVIATLQGIPDKIKRTSVGDFWVAVTERSPAGIALPKAIRINGNGVIIKTVDLSRFYYNTTIGSFQGRGTRYYVGSLDAGFLGVIN